MIDRNPHHLRHWVDWQQTLLADAAARADSLAGLLAEHAFADDGDDDLDACVVLADRILRDLERILVEVDAPPTIETRSRAA